MVEEAVSGSLHPYNADDMARIDERLHDVWKTIYSRISNDRGRTWWLEYEPTWRWDSVDSNYQLSPGGQGAEAQVGR